VRRFRAEQRVLSTRALQLRATNGPHTPDLFGSLWAALPPRTSPFIAATQAICTVPKLTMRSSARVGFAAVGHSVIEGGGSFRLDSDAVQVIGPYGRPPRG
jgi:hypothetical protein